MKAWHIAAKDLRIIIRDIPGLIYLFVTPIIVIAIASFALSGLFASEAKQFEIPVVLEDSGAEARMLVDTLLQIPSLKLVTTYEDSDGKERPMSREQAEELIPDVKGAILIPSGYSQAVQANEKTQIIVLKDPVDRVIPSVLTEILNQYASSVVMHKAAGAAGTAIMPNISVVTQDMESNKRQSTPFESNVPGYAVMFVLLGAASAASVMLEERENGTLRKLRTLPISKASVLSGKMISSFITATVQCAIMFAVGAIAFGMWLGNSIPGLVLMILGTAFAATGMSMLLASFCKTRAQASGISVLVVLSMSALGGSWWPLYIVPEWMQTVAHVTLTAWAMDGFSNLLVYGRGFGDILLPFSVLFGIGAVCLGIGVRKFKF